MAKGQKEKKGKKQKKNKKSTRRPVRPRNSVSTFVVPETTKVITRRREYRTTGQREENTFQKEQYDKLGAGLSTELQISWLTS